MCRAGFACWVLAILAAAASAGAAMLADVQKALPHSVGELRTSGEDAVYRPADIFDYLDGGAEVYLAYGLQGCLAREYVGSGIRVTVDVFEMASSADAFGTFTVDQDGETVGIGQGALLRPGWLSFWKGPCFVSLTADADTPAAQASLQALGTAVAAAIRVEGKPPELLRWLPRKGLAPHSERYFHSPILLGTHVPAITGNPLQLEPDSEAVLGRIRRGKDEAVVIVVRYPSNARAKDALFSVVRDRGGLGKALGPGSAVGRNADRVAWVLLSSSADFSVILMGETLKLSAQEIKRMRRGGSNDVRMF